MVTADKFVVKRYWGVDEIFDGRRKRTRWNDMTDELGISTSRSMYMNRTSISRTTLISKQLLGKD